MKRRLLTNFNRKRWEGINLKTLKEKVKEFNNRSQEHISYGQIEHPKDGIEPLTHATHSVSDLFLRNKKLYGKVEFLKNKNGESANKLLKNDNYEMGFRGIGDVRDGEILIDKILSWDIISKK